MVIPTQPVEALMYFHTTMSSYATPSERDEGARGRISQLDIGLHLIKFGSDFSYNLHIIRVIFAYKLTEAETT